MAPADLLLPLEGQREETLRLLEGLTEADLDQDAANGRSVGQLLTHLIERDQQVVAAINLALSGDVQHLSDDERERLLFLQEERPPTAGWDLARLTAEFSQVRRQLRETFAAMPEEDLDRAIRWPGWPARTIRTSIPYMLEHEDSHLDELRQALERRAGGASSVLRR